MSNIAMNTDLSYVIYGSEGLVYNASSNSTIINIPAGIFVITQECMMYLYIHQILLDRVLLLIQV